MALYMYCCVVFHICEYHHNSFKNEVGPIPEVPQTAKLDFVLICYCKENEFKAKISNQEKRK